jgi:hypothetical protein
LQISPFFFFLSFSSFKILYTLVMKKELEVDLKKEQDVIEISPMTDFDDER